MLYSNAQSPSLGPQRRPTKHPWDKWLRLRGDRAETLWLEQGVDFDSKINGMAVTIRQRAEKMNLRVSITLAEEGWIGIVSVKKR